MNKHTVLETVNRNLLSSEQKLIYLIKTGSTLYNTDDEDSDLDIKGIYLPPKENLILNDFKKDISYSSSGKNKSNSSDDVDIDLYSIHRFFSLFKKGDTNMYELIYGYSNKDAIIKNSSIMERIYENRNKLINKDNIIDGFLGYAYGQYKKYYEKNNRLNILKGIKDYFNKQIQYNSNEQILDYYQGMKKYLLVNKGDFTEEVVSIIEDDIKGRMYEINNRKYHLNTPIYKFLDSIESQIDRYGDRVDGGIDNKSIYHAYRMLYLSSQLATEGDVTIPFDDRQTKFLKDLKNDNIRLTDKSEELKRTISLVRNEIKNTNLISDDIDTDFIENLIKSIYIQ